MTLESIPDRRWDVVIVGGGAAGLMAAAAAAQQDKAVLLLEKNRKFGVKILMSGGTRCNITHNCDIRGIVQAFGRNGKFLHSALSAMSPAQVVELFESLGVETKVESTGKVFPVSNKAIDVRDALMRYAVDSGAVLVNECPVDGISVAQDADCDADGRSSFRIQLSHRVLESATVVITTGGLSFPGCGTTGDGYAWAESFGHSIVPTVPALTPVLSNCEWANELKGVTIDPTSVEIWEPEESPELISTAQASKKTKKKKRKPIAMTSGSFLFTHFGFSGPAAMDVSRAIAAHPTKKTLQLKCDFVPDQKSESLLKSLVQEKNRSGSRSILRVVSEKFPGFPKRLTERLIEESGVSCESRVAELSSADFNAIVNSIKKASFPLQGTLGYEKAEVTAGGVKLSEVNSSTMESKLQEGLFFAGEILDLDGPIGGFNFQSAWSTGWVAGLNAAVRFPPR